MKTGRPVETELSKLRRAGEQIELWPRPSGGKNWPHAAFNPETGLLYANTMHQGALYKHLASQALRGRPALHVIENLPIAEQRAASRSATSRRSIR